MKLNLRFMAGVPDVWLSGTERDLWLELKYMKSLPPLISPEKLLTTLQQLWLLDRYAEGRSVAVLIGSSEGHVLFHELSWKTSLTRETFMERAESTREIGDKLVDFLGERVLT